MKKYFVLASLLLAGNFTAIATTIQPHFDTFAPFPTATFGGNGIVFYNVAITTITTPQNDVITLGLTASGRYSNPTLWNNDQAMFHALWGLNDGLDGANPPHTLGPTWNFDWYIDLADNSGADYSFGLLYSNNRTGDSTLPPFGPASHTSGTAQDSWNLSMPFLDTIGFDPYAVTTYGFELEAFDANGGLLGSTAITVTTESSSIPEITSTGGLLALAVGCLAIFSTFAAQRQQRRRN